MSTRPTHPGSADVDARRRPPPDEADLGDEEVGVTDLNATEYADIVKRSAKRAMDDQLPDAAAAIAYYGFLAIPAVLLISVGVFSLFASPSAVDSIVQRLGSVMPAEAVALLEEGLNRTAEGGGGLTIAQGCARVEPTIGWACPPHRQAPGHRKNRKEDSLFEQRGNMGPNPPMW